MNRSREVTVEFLFHPAELDERYYFSSHQEDRGFEKHSHPF